jgi:hypothetical protein
MKKILMALAMAGTVLPSLAADSINLVTNPGFEASEPGQPDRPQGWGVFTESQIPGGAELSTEKAQEGKQSLKMFVPPTQNFFIGAGQEPVVSEGDKIKATAHVLDGGLTGSTEVKIGLEWKRIDGTEISRRESQPLKAEMLSKTDWTPMEVDGIAPPGAVRVGIVITFLPQASTVGHVYVDNVVVRKVP